jgi:hypothetical protein
VDEGSDFRNEDRIPEVLNMKLKGKRPSRRSRPGFEHHIHREGRTLDQTEGEELWEDSDK